MGGKLIEDRSDLLDHVRPLRQKQHTSGPDHRHASSTGHRPSLPLIDEKLGILGLSEHDRFSFAAIEKLSQFHNRGAFRNLNSRKPAFFFGLRQSERAGSRRVELKLLEHRSWDEDPFEESTEYLDAPGNSKSDERTSVGDYEL